MRDTQNRQYTRDAQKRHHTNQEMLKIDNIQIALNERYTRDAQKRHHTNRERLKIDNIQITLNEKARRELISTSNQSSEFCKVAQYPNKVGVRAHHPLPPSNLTPYLLC